MAKTGRPRSRGSGVRKYFKHDEETKMNACLVHGCWTTERGNCGKQIKGKYPTNLKGHLKKEHPQEFKALELEEEARKEKDKEKSLKKPRVPSMSCSTMPLA